ncbi:hypothetical protein KOW79_005615 [Hemibagrus wyckioides]|uniref:Uncharacterized protein n=1 Tax=Hemibagrus wyckioides TaxID=337641 RepID=A0A9D3NYV4_9TELE|nr:hypothetical protein KOW79_005615 [Hemibagrus wyckioides]
MRFCVFPSCLQRHTPAESSGLDRKAENGARDNVNALPSELKLKKNPSDGCERWNSGVGSAGQPRLGLQRRCHGAHRAGREEEGGEYRTVPEIIIIIIVVAVVASRDGSRSQLCPGSSPHALQEVSLRRRQGKMRLAAPRCPVSEVCFVVTLASESGHGGQNCTKLPQPVMRRAQGGHFRKSLPNPLTPWRLLCRSF